MRDETYEKGADGVRLAMKQSIVDWMEKGGKTVGCKTNGGTLAH